MMKTLRGPAGDYLIERGLISSAAEIIKGRLKPERALIVSDSNVFPIYGSALYRSLESAGISPESIVIPAGEDNKNLVSFQKILSKLSESDFSRSDVLIALGGGVIGDLGGFAASCFKRGMGLVQMPSSLLAMVDSSVGGKTGVDFNGSKNQLGSFYEPMLTICDPDLLETLPEREYKCGCAEIIKTAVLFDAELFSSIADKPVKEHPEEVIEKCVEYKLKIVAADLHDRGCRQLLNFGHSIGHAAEALSGYKIAHGEAVSMGMAAVSRAACSMGLCDNSTPEAIIGMLEKYALPTEINFSADDIYSAMLSDKKASGRSITLIVPRRIGLCELRKTDFKELRDWLAAGGIK